MKRLARVGVLVGAALGLFASNVAPAAAVQAGVAVFVGTAQIQGGGLGYPCTPVGTTANCPPIPGVSTKPKPGLPTVPNVNLTWPGGNSRGFFFTGDGPCAKLTLAKGAKDGVSGGLCTITATGGVTGYCGGSTGAGTGTLTTSVGVPKPLGFQIKFWSVGGTLVVDGTYSSPGKSGLLKAVVEAVPTPGAGSCTDKTATNFIIVGVAFLLSPNIP